MAATTNLLIETSLDVVSKQRELVQESLGSDGVYIRMKETVEQIYQDGTIKASDRAEVISQTMAALSNSITQTSMTVALDWAKSEKMLAFQKEELQYKIDVLALEAEKLKHDVKTSLAEKQFKQATVIREMGVPTLNAELDVIALSDTGRLYEQTLNIKQDTVNKVTQNTQLLAQTEQTYATTHKLVADTYINHGVFTWANLDATGLTSVSKAVTGYTTLSDLNKEVAREQAKGYTYNAWSNAASGSGGMVGTLLAAEVPGLDPSPYLTLWKTSIEKLTGTSTSGENVVLPSITI